MQSLVEHNNSSVQGGGWGGGWGDSKPQTKKFEILSFKNYRVLKKDILYPKLY